MVGRVNRSEKDHAIVLLTQIVLGVAIITALDWAQTILMPVALAIFLTFLLNPFVRMVERRGLGRTVSVLVIVSTLTIGLLVLGWFLSAQVGLLMAELPQNTDRIIAKLKTLQAWGQDGTPQKLHEMVSDIKAELNGQEKREPQNGKSESQAPKPAAAVSVDEQTSPAPDWLTRLTKYLNGLLESLAVAGLALILLVFMLLHREDLRDRLLRLVGPAHVATTTKAVEETCGRLSRFLVMQAIVNGSYGLAVVLGLMIIGVPYALLWGVLAAALRYIPYLGAWIAAAFPLGFSIAMSDGWTTPIIVAVFIIVLELLSNNVMEPFLYCRSIGVSEVALLISAAIWAFLWGPIGMVMASPLTVVLVVLGQHVRSLKFLTILMSDQPALPAKLSFYQRLLAREPEEATRVLQEMSKEHPKAPVDDDLLIPTLAWLKKDRSRGHLTEEDEKYVLQTLGTLRSSQVIPGNSHENLTLLTGFSKDKKVQLLLCPVLDHTDRLAAQLLLDRLPADRWGIEFTPAGTFPGEILELAAALQPTMICLGSIASTGLTTCRYLCKRLRTRFPGVRLVVGCWGLLRNVESVRYLMIQAGADAMTTTLDETCRKLKLWSELEMPEAPAKAKNRRMKQKSSSRKAAETMKNAPGMIT